MPYTVEQAEKEREDLIARYVKDSKYTGFESEADGVNHLAFITEDVEGTIEFYTQVIRLKMLRVRAMVAKDFEAAFKEVDALCWPTAPTSAFAQDRPAPP